MATQQERNKAVVQRYFDKYWGKGNVDVVDELCTDDFVIDYPMHGPRRGKEAAKRMLTEFREAFPDVSFHAYQFPLIAEGDYVVGRWIGGGKHSGRAFDDLAVGTLDQPNTGKQVHFSGTTIFTLKNGRIVEEIGEEQALTALQQLGLVAPPNPGKEVKYDAEGNHV
ncbi:SnoaL-domain-containing protein [Aspergillus violaceofuscus CBS 115571]|uniref:SnoaL-domain-containing protein n=1 Tax=Aspergillus violaceofuscus (strain CBS 115571) TaxID=1450538 RepID=A0A2V5HEV8_ASPV1|nr:SnoaL-domain-containing protein [Aspergillus violaceofuscus CBS 115571]